MVKQELTPEELAAVMPKPGEEPPPSPLLQPPSIDAGWLRGPARPESAVGKMVPQPDVARTNGRLMKLDAATGGGFALLGEHVDPRDLLTECERAAWVALGASFHAVRGPDRRSDGSNDIVDIDGSLIAWLRAHGVRVVAVRPDFFVAASDASGLGVPDMTPTSQRSSALANVA